MNSGSKPKYDALIVSGVLVATSTPGTIKPFLEERQNSLRGSLECRQPPLRVGRSV